MAPDRRQKKKIAILEGIHGNGVSDKAFNNIKSLLHILILIS